MIQDTPSLRRNIRLKTANYKGQRWYFVTLCCANRRRGFANPEIASWLIGELRRQSDSSHFAVHAYCVMPDHLHALVLGIETASDLLAFMKNLKQETGFEFQKRFHRAL